MKALCKCGSLVRDKDSCFVSGGVSIWIIAERYCSKYNIEEKYCKNTGLSDVSIH